MVLLVVVMAVVLMLVARVWRDAGPKVIDVAQPAATVNPRGQSDALGALEGLPGLNDVRRDTDAHAQQVQDALAEIE